MTIESLKLHKRNNIPRHIAIIMDGNGRWAKRKRLGRIDGHRAGVKSVKRIVRASKNAGIEVLTLFAFSKENWNRPREEVNALMHLLYEYLSKDINELMENNIRIRIIGEVEDLSQEIQSSLRKVEKKTEKNDGMTLILALSYSGRAEIVRAVKKMLTCIKKGTLSRRDIDENSIKKHLYIPEIPDPDLLIRTSGEYRISNFLLWQIAYTEIYVTKKFWPDFSRTDLLKAIRDYQQRERRFGRTSEQIKRYNAGEFREKN
ncbi:MAG TPA: isoprenyl transferase [bacterium]